MMRPAHAARRSVRGAWRRWSMAGMLCSAVTLGPSVLAEDVSTLRTENSEAGRVRISTLASGLEHPWSVAPLPNGGVLITERPGRLRYWHPEGGLAATPVAGVPAVFARGQGGLLDVVPAPDFPSSRRVYLSYAEAADDGKAGTAVGYGRLSEDHQSLQDFQVIFRQTPALSTGHHFGSRLVFDQDGFLFITLGEHNARPTAQDLDKLQGKVVRLHADGRVPADNPFVQKQGARPEIWSYGHRNPQGAALHPGTGLLWTHEHGPRGGDEINLPQAGLNYGWPLATYGRNYTGLPIPEAVGPEAPGTQQPHHYWKQSPGISGMAFLTAPQDHRWRGNLFIGALSHKALLRLTLADDGRVIAEERLLGALDARIRDVRTVADGGLYVLTDARKGSLLRLELLDSPPR